MGYVAVTGGHEAIEASVELLREYRSVGTAQWSWRQFVTGWVF